MDSEERAAVYRQAGREWAAKDDRCTFVDADHKGVRYKFMGSIRVHEWQPSDWEVFTPPDDIWM